MPRWLAARLGRRRLALAALAALLLAMLLATQWIEPLLAWLLTLAPLLEQHPLAGALAFVVLSAVSAVLAFFSGAVLVPAAVSAWGSVATLALLWSGWWLGGGLTYLLGRGLAPSGNGAFDASGEHAAPSPRIGRRVARLAARLPAGLDFPIVFALQMALPSELPGYLCGYLRVRPRVYLAALALAELPYAVATVLIGHGLVAGRWLLLAAGAALLALVVAIATLRMRGTGITARDARD